MWYRATRWTRCTKTPWKYGPHWAGLTGALGVGGILGSRPWLTDRRVVLGLGIAIIACGVLLALSQQPLLVIGVQIALTLLVVAVSIPVMRSLHDAVPSGIRAGVASGVGTLTWLAFVPFALVIGAISESAGIDRAAWLFVAVGVVAAILMLAVLPAARPRPVIEPVVTIPAPEIDAAPFPPDRFLPVDDPDWPGHWSRFPVAWTADGLPVDAPDALEQARAAIADMPVALRRLIVLRDLEGRSADAVREALDISPADQRALLDQARALVRARLERYLERSEATG